MFDAPQAGDDDRTDDRRLTDGGSATTGALEHLTVVDRAPRTPATDVPPLGTAGGDDHPFYPMELSRDAVALPLLAAFGVAVGAQGSAFLGTAGAQAVAASVVVPVMAVVAVLLTLRVL